MQEEIVIRFRPSAFVSLAVVSTIATVVFAWLYVDKMEHRVRGEIDVMKSVYMGLLVASAAVMIRAFSSMMSKKPAMIINEKGITDYINLQGRIVPWENILKAEVTKFGPQKVMAVYVNNATQLTEGLKRIKQTAANTKTKKLGTPVMLPVLTYNFDSESTIALINSKAKGKP